MRGRTAVVLLATVATCVAAAPSGAARSSPSTRHLDELRVPLAGGKTIWGTTWLMPRRGSARGPLGDPETGVFSRTEDLARIASFHLESPRGPGPAAEALEWLLAAQTPDGRFRYGFDRSGVPAGPIGLDWPGVRAFWALAQGARVLPESHALRRRLLAAAGLTAGTIARELGGGKLVGGSASQTAAAVLGLVELRKTGQETPLLEPLAEAVAGQEGGEPGVFPYHAHLPTRNPALWHAYGAYQLAALAEAGMALGRRDLVRGAEREAASWTVHLLISGGPIWGFAPAPRPYPQIPYNLEPAVRGLLATGRATGNSVYYRLAGLFGAWLLGDNASGRALYDATTGTVRDGIATGGPSAASGAEATALGLATLQLLHEVPIAARYLASRGTGARRAFRAGTTASPRLVAGSGPYAGLSLIAMTPGQRVTFELGADGPVLLSPIYLRGQAEPGAAGALELHAGAWSSRFPLPEPADPELGPVLEVGRTVEPVEVRPGERAAILLGAGSTVPVAVDGVLVQPVVEYRAWTLGGGRVAVVKSMSRRWLPLQYSWPGAAVSAYSPTGRQVRAGEDLEPFGFALIESAN